MAVLLLHDIAWVAGASDSGPASLLAPLTAFGVPAFFAVSGYLWARAPRRADDIRRMIPRIAVPYVVWSALYLILEICLNLRHISLRSAVLVVFFGQSSWHLWFLPALAVAQLIGVGCFSQRQRLPILVLSGLAYVVATLVVAPDSIAAVVLHYSVVASLFPFVLGMCLRLDNLPKFKAAAGMIVFCVGVGLCVAAGLASIGSVERQAASATGGLFVAMALLFESANDRDTFRLARVGAIGPLAYGAYLSHMVPIDLGRAIVPVPTNVGAMKLLLSWALVCLVSLLMSAILNSSKWLGWIVGRRRR